MSDDFIKDSKAKIKKLPQDGEDAELAPDTGDGEVIEKPVSKRKKQKREDEPFSLKTHKVLFFAVICIGVLAVAIAAAGKPHIPANISADLRDDTMVKGAATQINKVASDYGIKSTDPQEILDLGREIVASQTAKIAYDLNQKAESIASDTARNVTNFVYRNTVERVIQNLIHTLPQERQEEYIKPTASATEPKK